MDIIVAKLINNPTKNNFNSYLEDSRRENHLKLNCCCPSAYREEGWFNPLNAELNPICHLLVLLVAHHILHVSRIKFNSLKPITLLNLTSL